MLSPVALLALAVFLVFFAPPVHSETPPFSPLTPDEKLLWEQSGVNAIEGGEWKYHGIAPDEASRWRAVGIAFPGWANQWKGEGFTPEEAAPWKELTNVYTAAGFHKAGFTVEEAREWIESGVGSHVRAREYRDGGLGSGEAVTFWKLGIYPSDAIPWRRAGFTAAETAGWHWGPREAPFYFTSDASFSRTVFELEWAETFRQAGFSPEEARRLNALDVDIAEAREWLGEGFAPDSVADWKSSGFSLLEARGYRDAGLDRNAAEAEKLDTQLADFDEVEDITFDLTLMPDGDLEVLCGLTLSDRPGGAFQGDFVLALPRFSSIDRVEVDGAAASHRLEAWGVKISGTAGRRSRIRVVYRSSSQVRYLDHHDELSFTPLDLLPGIVVRSLGVNVRLPPGAELVFSEGEAGFDGGGGFEKTVEASSTGDRVSFTANRILRQGMAAEVKVGFTKGGLSPGYWKRLTLLNRKFMGLPAGGGVFAVGILLSLVFFSLFRSAMPKTAPAKSGAPVQGTPGLSPALARTLTNRGRVDSVTLYAALMGLALKGALRVTESRGVFTLVRGRGEPLGLASEESALLSKLFGGGSELRLGGGGDGKLLAAGFWEMRRVLKKSYWERMRTDWRRLLLCALSALLGAVLALFAPEVDGLLGMENFRAYYAGALGGALVIYLAFCARALTAPDARTAAELEEVEGYLGRLRREYNFNEVDHGYLGGSSVGHLPYALALGFDLRGYFLGAAAASWFKSLSGPFPVGGFQAALRSTGRRFK